MTRALLQTLALLAIATSTVATSMVEECAESADCTAGGVCHEGTCFAPDYEVPCGGSVCGPGEECCNESCGLCVPAGGACTQQVCEVTRVVFDPCAQLACGAPCQACDPKDASCSAEEAPGYCQADGRCTPERPLCAGVLTR